VHKKVNLRIEHIKHSKCRDDFLRRAKDNDKRKRDAKGSGEKVCVRLCCYG
jgi:large subunit ribosomal protein L21e